jgi:HEAT repeat protein
MAAAPDPQKRKRAAILIGLGNAEVPSDLLRILARDDCAAVRKQAIRALGQKKVSAVMGLLLEALTDPDEGVRIETVLSLAEFGENAPLQELLNLLNGCSENLACAVVATIGRVGSDRAGRALLDYLSGRSVSRRVEFLIVETLGNLDFEPASELLKETYLIHYDPDFRRLAVQALGNIIHVHSLPAVAVACHDPHWSVRIAALHAVLKIGGEQALPILVAALSDPDYMVRKNAVIVLGESGNVLAIPHLVEQLDDQEMGRPAFDTLIRFGRKGLTRLHHLLTAGYTDEIRVRLIDVIGKIGKKRSVKPLLGLLEDPVPAIRLSAIDALVFCFDGLLLKKLYHLKMIDSSVEVNVKADLALRTLTMEKFF